MKEQWLLYTKSEIPSRNFFLIYLAILIGLDFYIGPQGNSTVFRPGFILFIVLLHQEGTRHLRHVLPLSKKQKFSFDVSFPLVIVMLVSLVYLLYFIITRASLEIYLTHIFDMIYLSILFVIGNTMPLSFKKNLPRFIYIITVLILVIGFPFYIMTLDLWPMERFVYSSIMAIPFTIIILGINYRFYDKLGYRNMMKPVKKV